MRDALLMDLPDDVPQFVESIWHQLAAVGEFPELLDEARHSRQRVLVATGGSHEWLEECDVGARVGRSVGVGESFGAHPRDFGEQRVVAWVAQQEDEVAQHILLAAKDREDGVLAPTVDGSGQLRLQHTPAGHLGVTAARGGLDDDERGDVDGGDRPVEWSRRAASPGPSPSDANRTVVVPGASAGMSSVSVAVTRSSSTVST